MEPSIITTIPFIFLLLNDLLSYLTKINCLKTITKGILIALPLHLFCILLSCYSRYSSFHRNKHSTGDQLKSNLDFNFKLLFLTYMYSVLKKKNLTHFNLLVLLVLLVNVPGQKRKLHSFRPHKLCV